MNDSDKAKVRRLAKQIGELSDFLSDENPAELVSKGVAMLEIVQGKKFDCTEQDILDMIESFNK